MCVLDRKRVFDLLALWIYSDIQDEYAQGFKCLDCTAVYDVTLSCRTASRRLAQGSLTTTNNLTIFINTLTNDTYDGYGFCGTRKACQQHLSVTIFPVAARRKRESISHKCTSSSPHILLLHSPFLLACRCPSSPPRCL